MLVEVGKNSRFGNLIKVKEFGCLGGCVEGILLQE